MARIAGAHKEVAMKEFFVLLVAMASTATLVSGSPEFCGCELPLLLSRKLVSDPTSI